MIPTVSGVIVNESLAHWNEVLFRWCAIVEQWCRICSPDRPWWHLEVPNAGLIASAAIASGYAALVESDVPKAGGKGRSDLWIQFGRQGANGQSTEEFVELKLSSLNNGQVDTYGFEQAMKDAAAVEWPCRAKIGGCIYQVLGSGDSSYFERLVSTVSDKTHPDALAWVFPGHFINIPYNGKIAPGMILVLKSVNG